MPPPFLCLNYSSKLQHLVISVNIFLNMALAIKPFVSMLLSKQSFCAEKQHLLKVIRSLVLDMPVSKFCWCDALLLNIS
jgi:hypothetical protein